MIDLAQALALCSLWRSYDGINLSGNATREFFATGHPTLTQWVRNKNDSAKYHPYHIFLHPKLPLLCLRFQPTLKLNHTHCVTNDHENKKDFHFTEHFLANNIYFKLPEINNPGDLIFLFLLCNHPSD